MHKSEIKKLTSQRDYHKAGLNQAKRILASIDPQKVMIADYWRKQAIGHQNAMESFNRQLGRHA